MSIARTKYAYGLNTRLDTLALTPRTRNLLKTEGFMRVADLVRITSAQLLLMKGVGPGTLAEVREVLTVCGLALREPRDELTDDDARRLRMQPESTSHRPESGVANP
ncbi:hypothetical protein R75461_07756 [Paraburkholderia nemoris]|uniref:DNA-directed RNA polymerase subunit alpha C-terminal domain-containing protein n=1 Tax=Paraburkholderia nemoris TaxID=2793076 RepID=UPI00190B9BE0|nr:MULTISPECIES: DNA-directed RNA polymerase subunit alpha C-terminal domain-containing protein [Paraburkholderia]MBK3786545.1 hypothetical protein [Paraburkholderia aspalathi]CAE6856811.1 hypothetical protein R75461_07756 [Paraburkholderia nemoris]